MKVCGQQTDIRLAVGFNRTARKTRPSQWVLRLAPRGDTWIDQLSRSRAPREKL